MLNVYLSGEIHSDWRQEIINLCNKENLEISFSSPITFPRVVKSGVTPNFS